MAAANWRYGRSLLDLRGGQMSHQEEKPKVGRDVEVEVDQSVHQKSRACNYSGKLQSPGEREITLPEKRKRFEKQNPEEPGTAETAQRARLGKSFQVIVVRVIDDFGVIKGLIRRIHDLKGAESGAGKRMVEENVPGARSHGTTLARGDFECLHGGKALQDSAHAQPSNDHQRRQQHRGHRQEALRQAAAAQKHINKKSELDGKAHNASAGGGQEKGGYRHNRE